MLGVLAVANVVAALVVFKPWGGSPAELEAQRAQLERQIRGTKGAAQSKMRRGSITLRTPSAEGEPSMLDEREAESEASDESPALKAKQSAMRAAGKSSKT